MLGIARSAHSKLVAMSEKKVGARGTSMGREAQVQATIAETEALIDAVRPAGFAEDVYANAYDPVRLM